MTIPADSNNNPLLAMKINIGKDSTNNKNQTISISNLINAALHAVGITKQFTIYGQYLTLVNNGEIRKIHKVTKNKKLLNAHFDLETFPNINKNESTKSETIEAQGKRKKIDLLVKEMANAIDKYHTKKKEQTPLAWNTKEGRNLFTTMLDAFIKFGIDEDTAKKQVVPVFAKLGRHHELFKIACKIITRHIQSLIINNKTPKITSEYLKGVFKDERDSMVRRLDKAKNI